MDTFEKCWLASEKHAWRYHEALNKLEFDFSKRFLPRRICGEFLPPWLSPEAQRTMNQLRGHSYAHIFSYLEEIIIKLTHGSANQYVHVDNSALSAMLRFAEEETKHQRMFELMKKRLLGGLGFIPKVLPDKETFAKQVCEHSPFAVYLLTLMLEFLTQRHYVECFREEKNGLDPWFVKVFRLHWTEEAQHTRIDILELNRIAETMSEDEISESINEFRQLLKQLKLVLILQNKLDLASFETSQSYALAKPQRTEFLEALNREFLWTFIISGLEHESFQSIYQQLAPATADTISEIIEQVLAA
jgi:hypothetical protein